MTGTGLDGRVEQDLPRLLAAEPDTGEQAGRHLAAFRDRFGPDALDGLDGDALLRRMHGRQGEDAGNSLAYWLEFKNDDEFSGPSFGSIAGGSSAKFGIYQRNSDSAWVIGWPGDNNVVPLPAAVARARRQRDELLAGHAVLSRNDGQDTSDAAHARLQDDMKAAAPELHGDGWAHKWWFLLHPDKLDGYHTPRLQRFHLLKLLQEPPGGDGTLIGSGAPRFTCAGRFVALTRALGVPMPTLMAALNRSHGVFHRYWRVGTEDTTTKQSQWPAMLDGPFVSIGWGEQVPDMTEAVRGGQAEARAWVKAKLDQSGIYAQPGSATRKAGELVNLAQTMAEGDIVLACHGQAVLSIGRVRGGYEHDGALAFPHKRPVEWLDTTPWTLPQTEGYLTSCVELGKYAANLLEVERRLRDPVPPPPPPVPDGKPTTYAMPPLDPTVARIEQVLERKGQVLLYGPPGTGKTHWALTAARELAARRAFGRAYADLQGADKAKVDGGAGDGLVRVCTFHPGYGYEDFMEGLRPEAGSAGHLVFSPRPGLFKRLCADAAARPQQTFILVVDEFNRGDVPRIFGELLTVIERDKRGTPVLLPVTGEPFAVPGNVRLIGTMNTADRSISLLDAALRRRFGFIELMPDSKALGSRAAGDLPLGPWLDALNARLRQHLKRDARNLQVGHAYLMPPGGINSVAELARVLRHDLVPLLEEYCYDDFGTLAAILGKALVDTEAGQIREEAFEAPESGTLIDALRFPEMAQFGPVAPVPDTEPEQDTAQQGAGEEGANGEAGTGG